MKDQIETLQRAFSFKIHSCKSNEDLESIRIQFLGKKSPLNDLLKQLSTLSIEEKKILGPQIHALKDSIVESISTKARELDELETNQRLAAEKVDYTLPSRMTPKGTLHPITQVTRDIQRIFAPLGFMVAEGPEVETDYYNFSALNFAKDHPARDMHDTFYLKHVTPMLLRTHTSNVQIHILEQFPPPVRVIMPGRVFRHDADISHSPVFHQVEGLYVDEKVSFAHLKATLQYFLDHFFFKDSQIRLRPSFFPFTEPSVEVDVACVICRGKGCGMCKGSGWLEVLGAGMVDPAVLENVGIDPEKYSGFAFGMGVERLAILKYGIPNIKLFYDNHAFFLENFR
ncbi:MAG: phenylalanine--tRNA ligase subunit alpha [Candidatus Margulisiibacteriota bacterium]